MADFEWSDFFKVGFLMFGGTMLAFVLRRAARSSARREFPRLAEELALAYEAPDNPRYVGRLVGNYEGIRVRVESDERARIVCYFDRDPGIDVRTYVHHKRTPPGYEPFSFGNREDDEWMKARLQRTDAEHQERLSAVRAALTALRRHRDRLRAFTLDAERIECVFDFGTPPYIPGAIVKELLPLLTALARDVQRMPSRILEEAQ